MSTPSRPALHALAERLGELGVLDAPATAVGKLVRSAIPRGPVKDALSGTWLGHGLHPLLTDVPIGTWTSATILDLVGGRAGRRGADRLVAVGVIAATPTAVTGLSDWADTEPTSDGVRRIGSVHALANVTALGLYAASLAARAGGRRGTGVTLGLAGAGALAVGGHLGGHLSYARGVGVDTHAFDRPVADWEDVLAEAEVSEGELRVAAVDGEPVLLARHGGELFALADRCAHRQGPLHEGELVDGCVECPLHGSRFALADGSVERGPSAYPQPAYETRVREGRIEVRRP
jgi:nitrite reductase/ring-hydroxylating ferredoxin subunit/uncharacterized membrane protein